MQREPASAGPTGQAQPGPVARHNVRLLPANAYQIRFTPALPVIGFAFDPQEGTHAFSSDRLHHFRTRANTLAFTPPGCEVQSASPTGGEYLTLTLPRDCSSAAETRQFTDLMDPEAIGAAEALRRLVLSGADALAIEVQIALLEACIGKATRGRDKRGLLTPRGLAQVEGFIAEHLAGPITVQAMAATIGLSAGYFTRALKATVGKSPHDYVIDRRIAAARALLCGKATPLAEIAAATGFASQSHMTTLFRKRLGITPATLRNRP